MTAEQTLEAIKDILHPKDDPDHDWSPDTCDAIDETIRFYYSYKRKYWTV